MATKHFRMGPSNKRSTLLPTVRQVTPEQYFNLLVRRSETREIFIARAQRQAKKGAAKVFREPLRHIHVQIDADNHCTGPFE